MPAARRRLAPDDRRELIVAAAAELYTTRGYDEVSSTELARAAGVSRGLLSHYFPTKRSLYLAALRRFVEMPEVPVPDVEGGTVDERVRVSVRGWMEQVEHGRAAWLAIAGLAGHPDEDITELMDRAVEQTVDQICEVTGLRGEREEPAVRAALHGYAGFVVAISRKWLQEQQLDRSQTEDLLTGVLLDLVRTRIPMLLGE